MPPSTPVRSTTTSGEDASRALRHGRPAKPTENIRGKQAALAGQATTTRPTTRSALLNSITVEVEGEQPNSDNEQSTPEQDENTKGGAAAFMEVIQTFKDKLQNIEDATKEANKEAKEGWAEVKRVREELRLALEETRRAREATAAAERKVDTLQNEMQAMKEQFEATVQKMAAEMAALTSRPPSWASVAAGSSQSGSRVSFDLSERSSGASYSPSESLNLSTPRESPTTSLKSAFKNSSGRPHDTKARLTIDLGELNNEDAEQLDSTAKMRQRLEEGLQSVEELSEVKVTDFKMWNTNSMVKVIRFEVAQEQEKKVREHSETWMRSHLRGARLVEAPRHRIKIHWVDKAYATDASTGHMREDAAEIFGRENNVNAHSMRWLSTPRDNAMHASAVVSVDTMEEAERLLSREEITFGRSTVKASQFVPRPRPIVCYHCAKIGHAAKKCNRPPQCTTCGEIGHSLCQSTQEKCANCAGPHRATDRTCPEYVNEMERLKTVHHG